MTLYSNLAAHCMQLETELSNARMQIALYAAEMSEAKADGFYSAQELFSAYQTAQQQILQQQAVIDNICVQFSIMPYNKVAYTQALTDHVNAEKVKMLEEFIGKLVDKAKLSKPIGATDNGGHMHWEFIQLIGREIIAELTKPTGEE